ncbi:MAG: hypothetical protein M1609_03335 [Firmicutes bacterium]|nr:hypothetical protein [Bacillota bacterium]
MDRIKKFLKSEEGEIVQWLVAALIIGVGSIPIILGIAYAINQTTAAGEERIRSILW